MTKIFSYTKRVLFFLIIGCLAIAMTCCTGKKSKEAVYDQNVKECMKPLVEQGIDVAKAKNICDCALKTMLKIDSSYLEMVPAKQKQFYSEHEQDIINGCDELRELMDQRKKLREKIITLSLQKKVVLCRKMVIVYCCPPAY